MLTMGSQVDGAHGIKRKGIGAQLFGTIVVSACGIVSSSRLSHWGSIRFDPIRSVHKLRVKRLRFQWWGSFRIGDKNLLFSVGLEPEYTGFDCRPLVCEDGWGPYGVSDQNDREPIPLPMLVSRLYSALTRFFLLGKRHTLEPQLNNEHQSCVNHLWGSSPIYYLKNPTPVRMVVLASKSLNN